MPWPSARPRGSGPGWTLIDALEGLDDYHYLHAARADLLRRLERPAEARAAYERALELVESDAERRFLEGRLRQVADQGRDPRRGDRPGRS